MYRIKFIYRKSEIVRIIVPKSSTHTSQSTYYIKLEYKNIVLKKKKLFYI